MNSHLLNNKVLICVGSGGVGKTTVSASLGVLAARSGKNVLVMTIDPSKRLKDALGLNNDLNQITEIPGQNYSGKIHACILDAEQIFYDFIKSASGDEVAEKLLNNRLYKQLSTKLSGSQEFTSLLQLAKVVDQKEYDLVILDTPPAQHAIDFLEAPGKIRPLFQEQIIKWFLGDSENSGLLQKVFYRGTRIVLDILERLTGSSFMGGLNDFFLSVRAIQHKIQNKIDEIQRLMLLDSTKFVLVTAFDEAKLIEADLLRQYLSDQQYHMEGVIINRSFPHWQQPKAAALQTEFNQWKQYYKNRELNYDTHAKKWGSELPVWKIPDFNKELAGVDSLEEVANVMENYAN